MASNRTAPRKGARGRAQFVIQAESETLEVHLDRQGFRRLLETLEQLAQTGDQQTFKKSGRQRKGQACVSSKGTSFEKLLFCFDDAPARKT